MAIPWIALAQIGMGGYNYIQQQKAYERQLESLNKLKDRSPEEMSWLNRTKGQSRAGTMDTAGMIGRASTRATEMGRQSEMATMGKMYGSGLENSVIADELKRKVSRKTLRDMQDESFKIAQANNQTQLNAQNQMGEYGRQRTSLLNQIKS